MITSNTQHGEKITEKDVANQRFQAFLDEITQYINGVNYPYTMATLPDATKNEGRSIYVTDAAAGAVRAYSDGTNWRINQTTILT